MIRTVMILVLLLASNAAMALSYTLEISEEELQEKVAAMMPMKKISFL